MPNLTVAVLGHDEYSKDIGKKGTTSDITFYNLKREATTVTLVEPTRYPERISSLFLAISMAQKAILVVDEVNASLGEMVLMLDACQLRNGILIFRNYLTPEQVMPLFRGTVVEEYGLGSDDRHYLRDLLLGEADQVGSTPPPSGPTAGAVPIDHFFPVKGVGTVILGGVSRGIIRRHDTVKVMPTPHTAHIRSIQAHDDDVEYAGTGDRVGLSLKGIEVDQLDRGYVLSTDPSLQSSSVITGRAHLTAYWPSPLQEGMVLSIGHWMQFHPCRIAYVDNSGDWRKPALTLRADRELVYPPDARAVLCYLEGGKLRIVGTIAIE